MSPWRRRSFAVAVAASLLAHGLFAALGLLAPGGPAVRGQATLDTVVAEHGCELTMEYDAPARPAEPRPVTPESPPADFAAKLIDAPPPPAAAAHPAPAVVPPAAPESGGVGGPTPGAVPAGAAGVKLFQVTAPCQSVVFVLDCSLSMGFHGAFDAARREVLASVGRLPPATKFQVVRYSRTAHLLPAPRADRYLTPDADALRLVADTLAETFPGDDTRHANALRAALALKPEVIFFVTDADELSLQEVRALAAQAQGKTVIHAIELNAVPPAGVNNPLRQLTQLTRGVYRNVTPRE